MATISDSRAVHGLSAVASPGAANISGTVTVGVGQTQDRITSADVAWAVQALLVGSGTDLVVTLAAGNTAGTTAFTAGAAQVETATVTAASGITGSGNATVTVTAAGMTGSPKAISVALTTAAHTTATLIAAAIAAALNADTDYAAMFAATSSVATVITTRKATASYTVGSSTISLYAANDATLNVAIANGTCTGITAAPTSADTTAGVLTAGAKIVAETGIDFATSATAIAASSLGGFLIINDSTSPAGITVTTAATMVDFPIPVAGHLQLGAPNCDGSLETLTIEPVSTALVSIISTGSST
jgi:hypothetical protein